MISNVTASSHSSALYKTQPRLAALIFSFEIKTEEEEQLLTSVIGISTPQYQLRLAMKAVPFLSLLQAGMLTSGIVAQNIAFVGSNANAIATVSFDTKTGAFKVTGNNTDSSTPSWQEVSKNGKLLYSIEETSTEHALTSYSIGQDGKLKKLKSIKGLAGPVSLDMHPTQPIIITAN